MPDEKKQTTYYYHAISKELLPGVAAYGLRPRQSKYPDQVRSDLVPLLWITATFAEARNWIGSAGTRTVLRFPRRGVGVLPDLNSMRPNSLVTPQAIAPEDIEILCSDLDSASRHWKSIRTWAEGCLA